jgi:hypothetical protein
VARLDAQHQSVLTVQNQNQQVLLSKLEQNQQQRLKTQDTIHETMLSVQLMQKDILSRQNNTAVLMSRDQKRTSASIRRLSHTVAKAADLETLSVLVKQSLLLDHCVGQAEESDRQVFFLGERQDHIMAYLIPFQDDIEFAIDYINSQYPEEVSKSDAEWLRSEFGHLISSSSQEKASQYPTSTATPLDRWSYPEDTVEYLKRTQRQYKVRGAQARSLAFDHDRPQWVSQKRTTNAQRVCSVSTESGQINVSVPNRQKSTKTPWGLNDVGLCYMATQNRSTVQVRARFLQNLHQTSQPKTFVQLNISVLVDVKTWLVCLDLMKKGTLPEIDEALRKGAISPFHMNTDGDNILLRVSVPES